MREPGARIVRRLATRSRLAAASALLALGACIPSADRGQPRSTLIVGIDVGGSLAANGRYDSALDFAANYLYAHFRGLGGLETPNSVFVGPIDAAGDDFTAFEAGRALEEMSVAQIAAHLRKKYPPRASATDFTPFFVRVAALVGSRDLALSPLNVVLLTDGLAEAPVPNADSPLNYAAIDMSGLEYLAHSVTVRVLSPSPAVAARWEQQVPRRRIRMVTVTDSAMATWERHHRAGLAPEQQAALWRWIADNVDVRVRSAGMTPGD